MCPAKAGLSNAPIAARSLSLSLCWIRHCVQHRQIANLGAIPDALVIRVFEGLL